MKPGCKVSGQEKCLKRESGVSEGKWESGKVLKCGRVLNVC